MWSIHVLGIHLEFDRKLHVLQTAKLIEPDGEKLEDEAMWSDTERLAWKVKPLPGEAFRFLTDFHVCRKTWRIVFKFGWPMERCPRFGHLVGAMISLGQEGDVFGHICEDHQEANITRYARCSKSSYCWCE